MHKLHVTVCCTDTSDSLLADIEFELAHYPIVLAFYRLHNLVFFQLTIISIGITQNQETIFYMLLSISFYQQTIFQQLVFDEMRRQWTRTFEACVLFQKLNSTWSLNGKTLVFDIFDSKRQTKITTFSQIDHHFVKLMKI